MNIKVNTSLLKSRNPLEHGFTVTDRKGKVVHILDDGYVLVSFNELLIKKLVSVNKKKVTQFLPLEWYIHKTDLTFINGNTITTNTHTEQKEQQGSKVIE